MKLVKNTLLTAIAVGAFTLSGAVYSQDDKAVSLDQLLQMVKDSKIGETKGQRLREAEFRKDKSAQSKLAGANNTKKEEEARSARLEATYKEQEVLLQQKRKQLDERLGSLKELFGHLTSAAGDLRSNIDNSIVSAQLPGRSDFLRDLIEKMNSETKLPSSEEIERLWYELQRETIESGKIDEILALKLQIPLVINHNAL